MPTVPQDDGPVCGHDPYPHYEPGEYEVRVLKVRSYVDPRFRRKVCLLECELMYPKEGRVSGFANLGQKDAPMGFQSKYYRWWVIANGGEKPLRGTRMTPRIFVGKVFRARVGTVATRVTGEVKLEGELYSVIEDLLEKMTG